MSKVAVLIPCYNEEMTIKKVIEDYRKALPNADIYVYNNNSKDHSVKIVSEIMKKTLMYFYAMNTGKAKAM